MAEYRFDEEVEQAVGGLNTKPLRYVDVVKISLYYNKI